MGQYFIPIILDATEGFVRTWFDPHTHDIGYKLMEHSYIYNKFMWAVEKELSSQGRFYKCRVVWSGDYAKDSFHLKTDQHNFSSTLSCNMMNYKYVVNHTKGCYFDKSAHYESVQGIHPLPILTAEGNGLSRGDYQGTHMELVGTWAQDVISVEREPPPDFKLLECDFQYEI